MIPERLQGERPEAVEQARTVLADGRRVVLQFDDPTYSPELLARINALCREFGDLLEVRFYGHGRSGFDFRVLDALPDVASFCANCLYRTTYVEVLGELPKLQRLTFDIKDYQSTDLLELLDPSIVRELHLGQNAKRNLDLGRLVEFEALESLLLEGHTKGIESVAELPSLTRLVLRSIPKKQRLGFVSTLPKLRYLRIILGGREDVSELASPCLEELEIVRVRAFATLPALARLPALRRLRIENQPGLTEVRIPSATTSSLADLSLCACGGLSALDGLEHLRCLTKLHIFETALDLEAILDHGLPESLRVFSFYTGREREDARLRKHLDERGYSEH